MAASRSYELVLSRKILRVLMILNPFFGFFIAALLIASIVARGFTIRALIGEHGASIAAEGYALIGGMRWIMVLAGGAQAIVRNRGDGKCRRSVRDT